MRRGVLIFNPKAGNWGTPRLLSRITSLLSSSFALELAATERSGHATVLARRAATDGVDVVFALGGDGTLREVATGVLGTPTAVAPLPGGTANVVALALGLPRDPLLAAGALLRAEPVAMDIGLCDKEIFLMQASAGLDARVVQQLQPALKKHLGRLGVLLAGLRQWLSYDYPEIELVADTRPLRSTLAVICNLPYYAGGWKMAPQASVTDRRLDLVLFRGKGRQEVLAFARDFVLGRHLDRPDVAILQVEHVELRGPAGLAIQTDGDAVATDPPVAIGLADHRLHILKPQSTGS